VAYPLDKPNEETFHSFYTRNKLFDAGFNIPASLQKNFLENLGEVHFTSACLNSN